VVRGYHLAVLTPNAVEFSRLVHTVLKSKDVTPSAEPDPAVIREVANQLGGLTILHKGRVDIITDGRHTEFCIEDGSPRR